MTSKEFWEDEPQLYYSYRFSFEKQIEFEQKQRYEEMKLGCWLQGRTNEIAVSVALNNAFNKSKKTFPAYEKFYKRTIEEKANPVKMELSQLLEGVTDKDERAGIEFNYWARL